MKNVLIIGVCAILVYLAYNTPSPAAGEFYEESSDYPYQLVKIRKNLDHLTGYGDNEITYMVFNKMTGDFESANADIRAVPEYAVVPDAKFGGCYIVNPFNGKTIWINKVGVARVVYEGDTHTDQ